MARIGLTKPSPIAIRLTTSRAGRDPDRGVDQLVREDRGDLRRHRVGGVRQVGPDEYLEMLVAFPPIISAFADRAALRARAGEADRNAHAGG